MYKANINTISGICKSNLCSLKYIDTINCKWYCEHHNKFIDVSLESHLLHLSPIEKITGIVVK